ncbi:MAG TPA: glutamine--tRNA ligase [Methylomirabilota bacterium]|nr:glutamine--tRNA ligase [Methylomirabilota bacterium]
MPSDNPQSPTAVSEREDFIREIVKADLGAGRVRDVVTRFPPEPNGYLHVGHAKAICLNFGVARQFGGRCHLRMDDTNPVKEDVEYEDSIVADVRWLVAGWADQCLSFKRRGATATPSGADFLISAVPPPASSREGPPGAPGSAADSEPFRASDYFDALHAFAVRLIERGRAYVCDHTAEEVDRMRGAPGERGEDSHWRGRSVAESLDLFARMKAGEFPDGARTLRARIDMASPNVWLRDPVLYRIRHTAHHHTGAKWCIYPLYDFAHGLSDYIEGVTHSLCTLEFVAHRPLYDWLLEALDLPRPLPHQYEFARLNLTHTVMSKRKLLRLVQEGRVTGWDDPRMPTISGMRRRGYPAAALRDFTERIGVARRENRVELALLEACVREALNRTAVRRMAVLSPLKVVIENYPADQVEEFELDNNPEDAAAGTRRVPFSRELWIDRDDFREVPPPKYFRLSPGVEVRLRGAYWLRCTGVTKDPATGEVREVRASYDAATRTGNPPDGRKVKATIHWVSAKHAIEAEVRLVDALFASEDPERDTEGGDWTSALNPSSLAVLSGCKLERSLAAAQPGDAIQFERVGYFVVDTRDSRPGAPVFVRTVTLKDAWARAERRLAPAS